MLFIFLSMLQKFEYKVHHEIFRLITIDTHSNLHKYSFSKTFLQFFFFFMKSQYWNVFMFSHSNISVRHFLMPGKVRISHFHVQMSSNQNKKNKWKTSFEMIFQKMTCLKHFWDFIKQGEKCTEITHQTITKHKSTDPINFWHIFPFVSKYLRVFGQRQIYCIVLCSLVFFFF